jgi:hypothetical protein
MVNGTVVPKELSQVPPSMIDQAREQAHPQVHVHVHNHETKLFGSCKRVLALTGTPSGVINL